jgi:predicted site-specific integrase-resolvase
MDRVLKAAQVREILGVCRTTLYELDRQGQLRSRKMKGNRLYYLESDVKNYLATLPYTRGPLSTSAAE